MELSTETKSIFSLPKRQTFILICLATLILLFTKKSMIENETAAFEFMADQPAGSIWIGCFLFGYRVTFSQCWGIVLVGEFVFLIPELIKIVWFLVIQSDPNYYEIQAFYPLSLMNLVDYQDLPTRYAYPFKALNLFEPFYWFVLALGIQHYARRGMKPAWTIVLGFYLPVFLLWLLFYIIVYG
jgi:hypothetical protein